MVTKPRDAWPEGSSHDQVSKQKPRAETNERTSLERVGSAVGASLSQSHQTTVIATGATSHRALDAQANTITPSFGDLSLSLFVSLILFPAALTCPPFAFSVLLQPQTRSPDVSIARLHAPPRC